MDLVQTVRKEGSRGGRADFKWEDVKNDAQRENYLGHSVMAPVGRWQTGKDLNWYSKGDADDDGKTEADRIKEEKRKVKEAEEDAMLRAMGLPVPDRASNNANLTPLGEKAKQADIEKAMDEKAKSKEESEERKDRKDRSRKDRKDRGDDRHRRRKSKSRSRDRHDRDRRQHRSRSRDRRRDRDRDDRRKHRSRSRDRHHRSERQDRHRERDDEQSRNHSQERYRRRRSRSPREHHDRRRN